MLKLYWLIATANVAVAFNGNPRRDFKEGEKVITTRDEYRQLLRLGFDLIEEKDIEFDDIFNVTPEQEDLSEADKKGSKKDSDPAETQAETPKEVPTGSENVPETKGSTEWDVETTSETTTPEDPVETQNPDKADKKGSKKDSDPEGKK